MGDSFFHACEKEIYHKKQKATNCIAKNICNGKGSSQKNGDKFVISQPYPLHQIKILPDFHSNGKEKDKEGQSLGALGKPYTKKAADQNRNQHIAHIRTDKIVMDEQSDCHLNEQQKKESKSIYHSLFFHSITAFSHHLSLERYTY
jgi:hypothetical protein